MVAPTVCRLGGGKTGVYSRTNLDRPEATWERITPPPDDPGCYSYYSGLAELNDYKES